MHGGTIPYVGAYNLTGNYSLLMMLYEYEAGMVLPAHNTRTYVCVRSSF